MTKFASEIPIGCFLKYSSRNKERKEEHDMNRYIRGKKINRESDVIKWKDIMTWKPRRHNGWNGKKESLC